MLGCNRLQRIVIICLSSVVFLWTCVKVMGGSGGARLPAIPEGETPWLAPDKEPLSEAPAGSGITHGDPVRRDAVMKAFKHAWSGYERDAFGCDDYHPVSRKGRNLTTDHGIGYMITDALDTMLIMGKDLSEEYQRARNWVANDLNFDRDGRYSTFEITIRVLGGLLSAYALSGKDEVYLRRAQELADRLLPAFNTPHGLPIPNVNFHSEPNPNWNGEPVSTAEAATLQLEFKYLAHVTGKEIYWRTSEKVMKVVKEGLKGNNVVDGALVPIYMSAQTGEFIASEIRLGSRGDSYYEYLLKQYLQTNRTEAVYRDMYDQAMAALHKNLVFQTPLSGLTYIAEMEPTRSAKISEKWRISPKQDHLVCFLGGSLLLGVSEGRSLNPRDISTPSAKKDWKVGEELTRTCMDTHKTKTGLSPEIAVFYTAENPQSKTRDWYIKNRPDSKYILRPETVESLFLGWRMTGNPKYREWGWQVFQAIEKYCRVPGGGYSGIESVYEVPITHTDNMETFFVAETLKYLYLLFDDSRNIPLDEFVLNTEAHPLPIFTPNIRTGFS
ncbi:glycoside hydrolase family 47 protein [Ceratobasidium sp. AG-I]|nr:glycoside hydrolase family 47 protein [Ceratobasidium sp. AG-I]